MPGIFIRSFSEPINPGAIPYAEQDAAIVRGVTRGFVDPSNPYCYSGSGLIDATTQLADLVNGGAPTVPSTSFGNPALSGGLLQVANASSGALLVPPAAFVLPANCKRALVGCWLKMPLNGYENTGTAYAGIMTVCTSTVPANNQYILGVRIDNGTIVGVDKSFSADGANRSAGSNPQFISEVFNGALHQVMLFIDTRSDQRVFKVFKDGALWAGVSQGWVSVDTNINVPAGVTARLMGSQGGFSALSLASLKAGNAKAGRFQVHDLTSMPDLDPLTIVQKDYQIGIRYLS